MKTVVEAWGEADLGPVRDALDDHVVWKSASSDDFSGLGFGGEYKGRDSVLALLSKLSINYYFQRYVAKEIISKDDIVWGLFDVHGSYFPTNGREQDRKIVNFETAFRWRVRNGKIVEAQTFFDTAALLAKLGRHHTVAA